MVDKICGLCAALLVCFSAAGCNDNKDVQSGAERVYVPAAPSYADTLMWNVQLNDADGSGADVFYIPSTWEFDWTAPGGLVSHYADPVNTTRHRARMDIEIEKVAAYMAEGNNFYSPYYRHITLDSWATLNEDTIARRYGDVAFVDVAGAFRYFLEHLNHGRPFVLAGFSQGGKSVVELLKTMPDEVRRRMVAAYVLGYKVTPQDLEQCPSIKAARDSADTGVTICYNSVSDIRYIQPIVCEPCAICINPVNWKTDATPAVLHDSITVTLSPEHHVLVLEGYSGKEYQPILGILNVGDFHGAEPWLYSECLRKNIALRIRSFRGY